MSDFIGAGERTVVEVLKIITRLPEHEKPSNTRITEMPPGIYTQVPMKRLLPVSLYEQLSREHQRSSADVLLVTEKKEWIVFRVQGKGHQGEHKARSDVVQEIYLKDAGLYVVNIHIWECENTFKEKQNWMSFFEITDAMRRAMVPSG